MKAIVAYVPVIHRAYLDFLAGTSADRVYVISKEMTNLLRPLQKDLRALEPGEAVDALSQFAWVTELTEDAVNFLRHQMAELIMPDEDISRLVAERYFQELEVTFVPVFLRWDRQQSDAEREVDPDEKVSVGDLDRRLMSLAVEFGQRSPDWWRQVGALLVQNGEIANCAFNSTVPNGDLVLYEGDPRGNYSRGINIEASLVLHAEAAIIADAARRGPRLEGAKLYVSTFPCPPCAKLIAYSGISELYYAEGYAMVDGRRILKQQNVRVIRVQT